MKLRWKEFLVALLLSAAAWYMVTGSEKVETQVEMRLEYRGQPANLKIKSGLESKLTVRIRGSRGLLRTAATEDMRYSMDLGGLTKGKNIIPIPKEQLPFWNGVEVIDVSPSSLEIEADIAVVKSVPLEADVLGEIGPDTQVLVTIAPPSVQLRGASELLDNIESLRIPVNLSSSNGSGRQTLRHKLIAPSGLDATPNEVLITLDIQERRKEVTVNRTVNVVNAPSQFGVFMRPDRVKLVLSVPESLAGKISTNREVAARAKVEATSLGTYSLPVRVSLPQGVTLLRVDPPNVTLTLEQKTPKPKK